MPQSLPALWASSQFCIYYRVLCWLPVTKGGDKWIQQHLLGLTEGLNSFWTLLLPKLIILKLIMLCYPLKNRPRWGKYPPSCLLQPGAETTSGIYRTESIRLTRLTMFFELPAFSSLQGLFSETLFHVLATVIQVYQNSACMVICKPAWSEGVSSYFSKIISSVGIPVILCYIFCGIGIWKKYINRKSFYLIVLQTNEILSKWALVCSNLVWPCVGEKLLKKKVWYQMEALKLFTVKAAGAVGPTKEVQRWGIKSSCVMSMQCHSLHLRTTPWD